MYHFVYKTTNLTNGKMYIGAHSTENLGDDYLGSGIGIKRAVRKYGKDNFQRIILEYFPNEKSMFEAERKIVNEEWVARWDTYNGKIGGSGGFTVEECRKGGLTTTRKYPEMMRENGRKASQMHWGMKRSLETRKKLSEKAKLRIGPKNGRAGKWIFTSPFGQIHNIKGTFDQFCIEHNLRPTTLRSAAYKQRPTTNGWQVKKVV